MLRNLRKAASNLSRDVHTTFSSGPTSHSAFVNKRLNFPTHSVRLGKVFAEGGFSLIHIAVPLSGPPNERFAVKRMAYASSDPESRRVIDAEIDFLSQLPPHPNVVRFHSALKQADTAFLLFELVDGGTLQDTLSRIKPRTESKLLSIFSDIVDAIAHLHAQDPPIAIRDVKMENILYDRLQRCYKLCDFGSVSTFAGRHTSRKAILQAEEDVANSCTAIYRAPELVDFYAKKFICEKVDIWALGCIWYGMLYQSLPFNGNSTLQIVKGLPTHLPTEPVYSKECEELLRGMLTVDVADRWDVFKVMEKVKEMQGCQMNEHMKKSATRLRRLRSAQFGSSLQNVSVNPPPIEHSPTIDMFNSSAALRALTNQNSQVGNVTEGFVPSHASIPKSNPDLAKTKTVPTNFSTSLIELDHAKGCLQPERNAIGGEDEWADFESAFGSKNSDTNVTNKTSGSNLSERSYINAEQGQGQLLIDFGDLSMNQSARDEQRASSSSFSQGAPGHAQANKDDDLIDFR